MSRRAKPGQAYDMSDGDSKAGTLVGVADDANSDSFSSVSEHTYHGDSSFSRSTVVSSGGSSHQFFGSNQNNNNGPEFEFNGDVTNFFGDPNDRRFKFNGRVKYVNGRRNI
jgi:hypothetical protein